MTVSHFDMSGFTIFTEAGSSDLLIEFRVGKYERLIGSVTFWFPLILFHHGLGSDTRHASHGRHVCDGDIIVFIVVA